MRTVPNLLTLSRPVIFLPLVLVLHILGHDLWAMVGVIAGASTDYLDGWLARRGGGATAIGKYIDTAWDKLFYPPILCVLLLDLDRVQLSFSPEWFRNFLLIALTVMLVFEFALWLTRIMLMHEVVWYRRFCDCVSVAAKRPGKLKVWAQTFSASFLLLGLGTGMDWPFWLGLFWFLTVIPLIIWSFVSRHKWPDD